MSFHPLRIFELLSEGGIHCVLKGFSYRQQIDVISENCVRSGCLFSQLQLLAEPDSSGAVLSHNTPGGGRAVPRVSYRNDRYAEC